MHGSFTPSSSHAMHIHPGTCAEQTQPPSVPFPGSIGHQPVSAGISSQHRGPADGEGGDDVLTTEGTPAHR